MDKKSSFNLGHAGEARNRLRLAYDSLGIQSLLQIKRKLCDYLEQRPEASLHAILDKQTNARTHAILFAYASGQTDLLTPKMTEAIESLRHDETVGECFSVHVAFLGDEFAAAPKGPLWQKYHQDFSEVRGQETRELTELTVKKGTRHPEVVNLF